MARAASTSTTAVGDPSALGGEPVTKVLIVDDEPDILLVVRINLEAEGFETVLAADGEQALERIASEEPDVVLLDVMMPVLDGWSVLERLDGFAKAPRVIVLSAKSSGPDIVKAVQLGAADYVVKPFDPLQLASIIRTVLDRSDGDADAHRAKLLERYGPE